jgi:uncharacterized protein (UPF0264 family)
MARLLVSVRSASEVEAALKGSASMIDVKEPLHGSLGRASISTMAEVISAVSGRAPLSAAMGEAAENQVTLRKLDLDYVKWGLANSGPQWRDRLRDVAYRWASINGHCQPVAVAYADWRQAQSPPPEAVWEFARDNSWKVLLLDTFRKDGRTLLDWLSIDEITQACRRCHDHGMLIALAGSLGGKEISRLLPMKPDVFAVRGAVCRRQNRTSAVDSTLVRRLSAQLSRGVCALEQAPRLIVSTHATVAHFTKVQGGDLQT